MRLKPTFPEILIVAMLHAAVSSAQAPAPPGSDLAAFAAKRFPQPVRVGDLIHRSVLQPLERRPVLGHVTQVVRLTDGSIKIVMTYGGLLGFGTRRIAVPVDAVVLLGVELEVLDFTPEQLSAIPAYDGAGASRMPDSDIIRMGLAHPSH